MDKNNEIDSKKQLALLRHSAVSFIEEMRREGMSMRCALRQASDRVWGSCSYSFSTLERWYYAYHREGFKGLEYKERKDAGTQKALSASACESLLKARREHPHITIKRLVQQLVQTGVLEEGTFGLSTIYRLFSKEGLDTSSIKAGAAQLSWPTKSFEFAQANEFWMCDMMHGPVLKTADGKKINTRLFALLDDCSRVICHAQYYSRETLECFLDTFKQALNRRGIPDVLYTDQGKVFTCQHLKIVCANFNIKLTHAKANAPYSKGKIERFFRFLQEQFQTDLAFNPVNSLEELNQRLWQWLEGHYHQRAHSALEGQCPSVRFKQRSHNIRIVPSDCDLEAYFLTCVQRRVRKDCTVSLQNVLWEVPVQLRGQNIQLRYDPFSMDRVEIYHKDKYVGKAVRCNKHVNAHTFHPSNREQDL